jgi:hypothetical protein
VSWWTGGGQRSRSGKLPRSPRRRACMRHRQLSRTSSTVSERGDSVCVCVCVYENKRQRKKECVSANICQNKGRIRGKARCDKAQDTSQSMLCHIMTSHAIT